MTNSQKEMMTEILQENYFQKVIIGEPSEYLRGLLDSAKVAGFTLRDFPNDQEVDIHINHPARNGETIKAIKACKRLMSMSLKEAKGYVQNYLAVWGSR